MAIKYEWMTSRTISRKAQMAAIVDVICALWK
jgi:hypothetical protein